MNVFLMHRESDFDFAAPLPVNEPDLTQDLELNTLFVAMAGEDEFLRKVVRSAVFSGTNNDIETILYRQEVLKDCLANPAVVSEIYAIAVDAIAQEKANRWGIFSNYPNAILRHSMDVLHIFVAKLTELRNLSFRDTHAFRSEGFTRLFSMLKNELTDEYFAEIEAHLEYLKFDRGVFISAELGAGNRATNYVLQRQVKPSHWWDELFQKKEAAYTLNIHPRDENGSRALSEISDKGVNVVADVLGRASDHVLGFFKMLRTELAFYLGCVRLADQIHAKGMPICYPVPTEPITRRHSFRGLYDVCLALRANHLVVGNDLSADGKEVVLITGANQGGKSTFLRSIGLAQLMMQSGMLVPAEAFSANLCDAIFTHYKREEDVTMASGKLDEELCRMSCIVDHLTSASLVFFNESFAATNEREGSEIAREITLSLAEKHIKSFFVTHLFDFAHDLYETKMDTALFLRAERQEDGERTFKLCEGEPLQTSYGGDLYRQVFNESNDSAQAVLSSA
jgi:DNA mismatch repair ATPase MutS